VIVDGLFPCCDCDDFELTGRDCKHLIAVRLWLEQENKPAPAPEPLPPIQRPSYPQDWKNYNRAQNNEKDHLHRLLADLCAGIPEPTPKGGVKGGRPAVPVRDALFSVAFITYCGISARRFMCDLRAAQGSRLHRHQNEHRNGG